MELWNENSIVKNNIQYIDYNLIEKISLVNETNKYREASKLTNYVICGASLKSDDLINKWKKDTQRKTLGFYRGTYDETDRSKNER